MERGGEGGRAGVERECELGGREPKQTWVSVTFVTLHTGPVFSSQRKTRPPTHHPTPTLMFGAFAAGFGLGGGTFAASYRVYPVSFLDRADAEAGDKLFLPPSALDRLGECVVCWCVGLGPGVRAWAVAPVRVSMRSNVFSRRARHPRAPRRVSTPGLRAGLTATPWPLGRRARGPARAVGAAQNTHPLSLFFAPAPPFPRPAPPSRDSRQAQL